MSAAAKRALILLPQEGFDDEAYRHVRAYLGTRAVEVKVAASATSLAKGERVDETAPDASLDAVDPAEYHAAIVIGGIGAEALADDARAHRILRAVAERGGVVGATGPAVLVLGRAGLLRGKKVTGGAGEDGRVAEGGGRGEGGGVVRGGEAPALLSASRGGALLGC